MNVSMNIIVTGASGFVGRYLCKHLGDAGHDVTALVRSNGVSIDGAMQECCFDDVQKLSTILEKCDSIIHLAGRAHVLNETTKDPLSEFRRVNVEMTEKLALLAAKAGVRRFIYVSSIGVNGNKTSGHPFTETDIEDPHDLYAVSKLEAEQVLKRISSNTGIDYVIVRPVLIYGPDAPGNFALLLKLASKGLPLPFRCMSSKRSLLSVWNLVDFLTACATHPTDLCETFLIADQELVTLADIFRSLGVGMKRKQIMIPIPQILLFAVFTVLGKKHLYDKLNSELTVDIRKAKKMLNWDPPSTTTAALVKTGEKYLADFK